MGNTHVLNWEIMGVTLWENVKRLFLNTKRLFWTHISTKRLLDFDILRPQYDSKVASREDIIIIIIESWK